MILVPIVVLSFAVYRVTRFLLLDTMFEGTRLKVHLWFRERDGRLSNKVQDGLDCHFCVSVWISAGAVALADVTGMSVPEPFWVWLAVCSGSLLMWRWVEGSDDE